MMAGKDEGHVTILFDLRHYARIVRNFAPSIVRNLAKTGDIQHFVI